ncbi:unnamed protein product, partial [Discosporangium mesarthrocarpum]
MGLGNSAHQRLGSSPRMQQQSPGAAYSNNGANRGNPVGPGPVRLGAKRPRVALWQLALGGSALVLLGLNVGATFSSRLFEVQQKPGSEAPPSGEMTQGHHDQDRHGQE